LGSHLALQWTFTMVVALLVDPHLLDYDLTILVLPGLLLVTALSDAPWWLLGAYVVTLADLPLTVGTVSVQVGVLLLLGLTLRLWWRLERLRTTQRLERSGPDVTEIPIH
jgi:hypothetical protein